MTLEIGVDETFAESVADRLRSIEDRLGDAAFGHTPFVTEAASHIINAGGKRFRPLFTVLSAAGVACSRWAWANAAPAPVISVSNAAVLRTFFKKAAAIAQYLESEIHGHNTRLN